MAKLGWGLIHHRDTLWARVLRHKYGCGDDILPKGIRWRVSNGARAKFWTDRWVPNCNRLCEVAVAPISNSDLNASVSSFITYSGGWDWAIGGPQSGDNNRCWKAIWNLRAPQRVRSFMWLCTHGRLLTNAERMKRQISEQADCDQCGDAVEDTLHVLRDCLKVKEIWMRLVKPCFWPEFFHAELRDWIDMNMTRKFGVFELEWKEVFATACWSIWRWRNEQVFNQRDGLPSDPVFTILHRVRMASEAAFDVLNSGKGPPCRVDGIVKWKHPETDWVKVNVDGACKIGYDRAACGGVIRDSEGRFIAGFAKNLGSCDALAAELWGVRMGLELALEMGLKKVVIETDSACAHQLVSGQHDRLHPHMPTVFMIHQLLARQWDVRVHHVLREANRVADFLASYAPRDSLKLLRLSFPPHAILPLLNVDPSGIGVVRAPVA
ncbi:putative non-LTR retroelement reverse transcriptase [Senna tora]|uniref:Putative non-LTR retroelement reverse transcriptase n=1 Tax=Senna tora TaxID=362788 RepID=A0A834XCC5_9FABA|nr:putative non-LTR retroelement reverse transcriptase [Senna tora]